MSQYSSEKNLETHSPFCKHGRAASKVTPFVASAKTLESFSEKANQFDRGIALADQVSKSNLEQSVRALETFHTRHTASPNRSQVTDWLVAQFRGFGYTTVNLDPFTANGLKTNNVICFKAAQNGAAETIILCGHYDSIINSNPTNVTLRAPGANDNATGIAVILETARLLAAEPLDRAVQFVCFSGEEQGFLGAEAYSAKIQQANLNLRFLVNLDQIGFPSAAKQVVIEHDEGNVQPNNDQPSKRLAQTLAQVAQTRLNIPIGTAGIERSDYMPFEARGYTVIGLYESGGYQHQHTKRDTSEKIDYDYLVNMSKITVTAMFA
jgi:hypothetical protein